jgi:hypothetical protein
MKRWIERLKTPPSWRVMLVMNVVGAVFCIGLAVIADNRWIAILDGVIAGINIGGVFHSISMIRMEVAFIKMTEAVDQMSEINNALINGHFKAMAMEMDHRDNDGGAPPIAPKLH